MTRCWQCHAPIPKSRLKVLPDARYCIKCQSRIETPGQKTTSHDPAEQWFPRSARGRINCALSDIGAYTGEVDSVAQGGRQSRKRKPREPLSHLPEEVLREKFFFTAELAAVIGAPPLNRVQMTERLWHYIEKNHLQDKKNKRIINADETLMAVLGGKKQVNMFEMTKLVNRHISRSPKAVPPPTGGQPKPETSTWRIEDFPVSLRDFVVETAKKRGLRVADLVEQIVVDWQERNPKDGRPRRRPSRRTPRQTADVSHVPATMDIGEG